MTLPARTTMVGTKAFEGATALTTVNVGDNVEFAVETISTNTRPPVTFNLINAFVNMEQST